SAPSRLVANAEHPPVPQPALGRSVGWTLAGEEAARGGGACDRATLQPGRHHVDSRTHVPRVPDDAATSGHHTKVDRDLRVPSGRRGGGDAADDGLGTRARWPTQALLRPSLRHTRTSQEPVARKRDGAQPLTRLTCATPNASLGATS